MPTKKSNKPKKTPLLDVTACPFCSSTNWAMMHTANEVIHNVICTDCQACGPDAPSPEEAISLWNDRKTIQKKSPKWNEHPEWS